MLKKSNSYEHNKFHAQLSCIKKRFITLRPGCLLNKRLLVISMQRSYDRENQYPGSRLGQKQRMMHDQQMPQTLFITYIIMYQEEDNHYQSSTNKKFDNNLYREY